LTLRGGSDYVNWGPGVQSFLQEIVPKFSKKIGTFPEMGISSTLFA